MKKFLTAGIIGAALAYFLDPNTGTRRRNITRDKLMSLLGRTKQTASQQVTRASGTAFGIVQERVPQPRDNPNPDDTTLRDRVESEIFRDPQTSREHINVNVEDGIVVVRGEQPTQAAIDALVSRIQGIPDVKGVESYLHLPGTPAPNKESALRA